MKLELRGIDVDCVIGERPRERVSLQRLNVDVVMEVDDRPAVTDRLEDAVDYAALTESIRTTLANAKCRMIERAARIVADVCLADARVSRVSATVCKRGSVPHLDCAAATFVTTVNALKRHAPRRRG